MEQSTAKEKKSIFENPLLSTKIKSATPKLFPEGILGYFLGPTLALLTNSILANYFNKYMTDVLNITEWAKAFFTWLPVVSVIFVVIGNILIGRLMDRNRTKAGKARPLLLLSVPISILALLVLFVFKPFATETATATTQMIALVLIAIGYNLWFAIAYPMYYTSHAALVNLSTRSRKDRSLLATISNATSLAAVGLTSMILPFFLGMLFVNQMDVTQLPTIFNEVYEGEQLAYYLSEAGEKITLIYNGDVISHYLNSAGDIITLEAFRDLPIAIPVLNSLGEILYYKNAAGSAILDQQASADHWKIFVIALMIITFVGALVEYFFTRERVTEESFTSEKQVAKKAAPLSQQAKICFKDKFWWIMVAFFFLYQLGGMMKNTSQGYFCTAMFPIDGVYSTANGGTFQGTLSIIGAIPTALGMVIAWPLSNKIGKGKAILFGAILSVLGGALGFIAPDNFVVCCISFVIKALGSTPAMYLSMALLADVLDHQEAMHGVRTDGLTMTFYGAIMAGMTGIATGILNIVLSATGYSATNVSSEALQSAMPWLFIGGETICYGVIVIIFIFMGVEKFSKFDHKAIVADQRAIAEAEGREYIEPAERLKMEEAEAEAASEEARKAELKEFCAKKGLSYEEEEAKYQKAQAEKQAAAEAKKAEAEAKKAAAEKAQAERIAAMSAEERAALEAKQAAVEAKKAKAEADTLAEFNRLREANGRPVLAE